MRIPKNATRVKSRSKGEWFTVNEVLEDYEQVEVLSPEVNPYDSFFQYGKMYLPFSDIDEIQ